MLSRRCWKWCLRQRVWRISISGFSFPIDTGIAVWKRFFGQHLWAWVFLMSRKPDCLLRGSIWYICLRKKELQSSWMPLMLLLEHLPREKERLKKALINLTQKSPVLAMLGRVKFLFNFTILKSGQNGAPLLTRKKVLFPLTNLKKVW